ncbi:hypothetical protein Hte_000264 [Hypoxylon texense]
MSLPQPPVPLDGACSVIFNNTLYSYSANGFESLPLEDGAEWEELPSGHKVEGGVCVGSTPGDSSTAGLFIVGGKSTSSDPDYSGLQKFTYSTGKWETIIPQVNVTKDRVWHSATYINSSDAILVYSGSTDGEPNLSSQTFTIMASEPHLVLAFQSTISPPGVAPILLPWSDAQAVMIGGNPTNMKVMLFDTANSWSDSGTTLAEPLAKNTTDLKAALITGDDGSKHLYTFDLTTSPNTVNRTMLLDATGAPIANAVPAASTGSSRRLVEDDLIAKRALTADQWPKYNSTLVPDSTRNGYSIATDSNGLVVMSGGNDDEILCMFDARANGWKNATAVFGQQKESTFGIESSQSSTSSSIPTSTTAPATSSTASATVATTAASTTAAAAAAASSSSGGLPSSTLLGVVLGTIFGFAIILLALLFWLKHVRKRKQYLEAGHARRASGLPDEKDFFREEVAKASGGQFRGHVPQDSAGSFSSMAILMGKVQKPALQRKTSNETKRSSVSSIFNKQFKNTIGRPQLQVSPEPELTAIEEKGVSFAATANEPKPRPRPAVNRGGEEEGLRRSSGWNRYWSGGSALSVLGFGNNGNSNRETGASEQSSFYSDKNRLTQDSATVPALRVEGRPELNRVISGSPTVSQYNPQIREEMAGQIERPVSAASSGYSSGIPASVHDTWDPTMAKKAWGDAAARAPSSTYSQSIYQAALAPPGTSRPPTTTQPQLAMASNSNDLSWLNLGENNNQPFR